MRYEPALNLLELAIELQARRYGMTTDDIMTKFDISRRTAERMRTAVEQAFGPLGLVRNSDRKQHWTLRSPGLKQMVWISPEELVEVESAASQLEKNGLKERSEKLRSLGNKIRVISTNQSEETEEFLEQLMRTESLAMYPGPKIFVKPGLLSQIRQAIHETRRLAFEYTARSTGKVTKQLVEPYGFIYGIRPYMVAKAVEDDWPHLWIITNMADVQLTEAVFKPLSKFDLQEYAERSFGAYQEDPFEVVLRFSPDSAKEAQNFRFHPTQKFHENEDKSLTVRFTAGGSLEMFWHLITWGTDVTVEEPAHLREYIVRMCSELGQHHDLAG